MTRQASHRAVWPDLPTSSRSNVGCGHNGLSMNKALPNLVISAMEAHAAAGLVRADQVTTASPPPEAVPEAPPREPETEPRPAPSAPPERQPDPDPFNPEWPDGRPEPQPKA